MKFYTIGYGGRPPDQFVELAVSRRVKSVADVRIRPDRASMGAYTRARTADKGIEKLLAGGGILYRPILELGNLFLELDDWRVPYRELLAGSGDLLTARLVELPVPFCLLCAEKRAPDCHRQMIADYLVAYRGWDVEHLE